MRKETPQESSIHELLPPYLSSISQVDMSYSGYFRAANRNMHEFYGPRADLYNCLEQYCSSQEYRESCHIAYHCEDIPIISKDTIFKMIQEDEAYLSRVNRFLKLINEIPSFGELLSEPSKIMQAAKML